MKTALFPTSLIAATAVVALAGPLHAQNSDLKTPKEKTSYAIGMQVGGTLKRQGLDLDPQIVSGALHDALTGASMKMTDAQVRETLTALGTEMAAKQQAAAASAAGKNKQEGEAFLAKNKSQPGVKVLPDGLQYQVVKEGTGATPTASDTVSCNYRGTLIDGSEFDSSAKHGGEPAKFPVGGVIKGWTEALQLMKVGSKWKLFVPSALAYGDNGTPGGPIPPGATLIFDIELLGIEKK